MKKVLPLKAAVSSILQRTQTEYRALVQTESWSLKELFSPAHFRFDEFCRGFSPHPDSTRLTQLAQQFGEEHDIWLPNAKGHVSCALFLYPSAHAGRMIAIMKNLIMDFYLNDVMGRDLFKFLSVNQQRDARRLIASMAGIRENLVVSPDAHPIEHLNAQVLREFRENSPEPWFRKFFNFYCHHLNITHSDNDSEALGYIPEVDEYIDKRCHYAGMYHIVLWVEYNNARFLDWDLLGDLGLASPLRRLHYLTTAFGALSNDLFSFEKEVIDQGSDCNLVMVAMLNNPQWSLKEGIAASCRIVRDMVHELSGILRSVRRRIDILERTDPGLSSALTDHIEGVLRCIQASWLWQCHSTRYKRAQSLWEETTL
ncbi:MAG TPA: terpene synthase family protein [Puia sp.]|nr:terpene synthase family protein [Puia sp.]